MAMLKSVGLFFFLYQTSSIAFEDNEFDQHGSIPSTYIMPDKPWIGEIGDFETYQKDYQKSIEAPGEYWADIAKQFKWEGEPIDALSHDSIYKFNFDKTKGPIFIEWFKGLKTNLAYNALDRQIESGLEDRVALYYERNEPTTSTSERHATDSIAAEKYQKTEFTYSYLRDEVNKLANALRDKGVKSGDRVAIFMAHIPENCIAMLACARIGAVHSVIFGGFSKEALANRIVDSGAKVVITQDGVMRGAKKVPLKQVLDDALPLIEEQKGEVHTVIVHQRLIEMKNEVTMHVGRDYWWHDITATQSVKTETEWVDAEHPLFILYTSGSTGKPKGIFHTTGGYMVSAATSFKNSFGYQSKKRDLLSGDALLDVFFCTADFGWITGHTYGTYGPLLNGASQVIYEGLPMWPTPGRILDVVDKYSVTHFYTAPTLLRALMGAGNAATNSSSKTSLKLLGTVGEPINPEVWKWFYEVVGLSNCPIVDTWWQTETGAHMLTPLPLKGWTLKPGSASLPSYGIQPCLLDANTGKELIGGDVEGWLAIKHPWPSTLRGVWGDAKRFEDTYFPFDGFYLTGDGARRDSDGYYWITGRIDDVMIVSGHNIGSAEVESALVKHAAIAEAAVVGKEHAVKGQSLFVFVTPIEGFEGDERTVEKELKALVRSEVGAFASPDQFQFAYTGLPKTRSGKIMRRILRKIANDGHVLSLDDMGDISTLSNPDVVNDLLRAAQNCEAK